MEQQIFVYLYVLALYTKKSRRISTLERVNKKGNERGN